MKQLFEEFLASRWGREGGEWLFAWFFQNGCPFEQRTRIGMEWNEMHCDVRREKRKEKEKRLS